MILQIVGTVVGFVLLAKGAGVLVDGACSIAKRYKVSDLVIGLTIVALGTSTPELIVCIISALKGSSEIALGNVLGSNIANLCLVLGITGLVVPVAIQRGTVWREIPFCLAVAITLFFVVVFHNTPYVVSRWEALVLIAGLAIYLAFMFVLVKESPPGPIEQDSRKPAVAAVMVIGGLAALVLGGELAVRCCVGIARQLGISEAMIGVTVVAIGTSLPELAACIAGVMKGKPEIAIGNVVGSNILNICLVLGSAAAISPLSTNASFTVDAIVVVAASAMLFLFMFTGKKRKLDRWEAVLFLTVYAGYIAYAIYRG